MIPEFRKLMTHDLIVRKRGRNHYGDFSDVSTFSGVKGFVEYTRKMVIDRQGEEVLSIGTVFLPASAPMDPAYEYWMIDQVSPHARGGLEVIQVSSIDDPRTGRTHHFEVSVK